MHTELPSFIILAGGMGTRIKTLTGEKLPKSLVPVNGEPFVAHQLKLLLREGVQDVIFCLGHLSQPVVDYVGDGHKFGMRAQYSFDGDTLLGTAGAVKQAATLAGEEFAVLYGDSYLDIPYKPVYDAFKESGKDSLMTVFRNENQFIKSNILFEDGVVKMYAKTLAPFPEMAHVDFGLSFYKRAVFDEFTATPLDLAVITQSLISRNQLAGYEVRRRFYEVGTPEGVHDLEQYLLERRTT
jgi:NDP-sugar pyrophosphorylase family protein